MSTLSAAVNCAEFEVSQCREICGHAGLVGQRHHQADHRVGFGNGRGKGFPILQSDIFFASPVLDELIVVRDIPLAKSHLHCGARFQAKARVRDHHRGNEQLIRVLRKATGDQLDGVVLERKRVVGGDVQVRSGCVVAAVSRVPELHAEHRRLNGAVFGDIVRLCIGHAEELGVPIPRHEDLVVDHHLLEADAQQEHPADQGGRQDHPQDGHRSTLLVQPQVFQGIRGQDVHARTASSRMMCPSAKVMMRSACRAMSRS